MKNLPSIIPVFPLSSNLFSKNKPAIKYFRKKILRSSNDAFKRDKLMGMVQSQRNKMKYTKLVV